MLPALRSIVFTVTIATTHVVKHPWSEFGDTEKHFRYARCVQSNSICFIDDFKDIPAISSQVNKSDVRAWNAYLHESILKYCQVHNDMTRSDLYINISISYCVWVSISMSICDIGRHSRRVREMVYDAQRYGTERRAHLWPLCQV